MHTTEQTHKSGDVGNKRWAVAEGNACSILNGACHSIHVAFILKTEGARE